MARQLPHWLLVKSQPQIPAPICKLTAIYNQVPPGLHEHQGSKSFIHTKFKKILKKTIVHFVMLQLWLHHLNLPLLIICPVPRFPSLKPPLLILESKLSFSDPNGQRCGLGHLTYSSYFCTYYVYI